MVGKFKVHVGDCREVLTTIPHKFDFIFADPPFNIGHPYKGFVDKIEPGNYSVFTLQWVALCWERLSPNGVLALHGPDALAEQYILIANNAGMQRIAWVNWHYQFGVCNRHNWIDARCHCLIYAKNPQKYTWNPDAVLIESERAKAGDKRTKQTPRGGSKVPGTVWGIPADGPYWGRVQGNSTERRSHHPNQLPEVYLQRLIRAYTNEGDLILDPFCGSGTTATVAVAENRNCITIDISESNAESARERIRKGPVRT